MVSNLDGNRFLIPNCYYGNQFSAVKLSCSTDIFKQLLTCLNIKEVSKIHVRCYFSLAIRDHTCLLLLPCFVFLKENLEAKCRALGKIKTYYNYLISNSSPPPRDSLFFVFKPVTSIRSLL